MICCVQGVVYSESNNMVEALRYYELAVKCNPSYVEALSNIGVIYKNSGQLESAIEFYERALKANPNFAIANNNLAIALTDMGTQVKNHGHIADGIRFYKRALVHNAKYPPAWYNLGVAHVSLVLRLHLFILLCSLFSKAWLALLLIVMCRRWSAIAPCCKSTRTTGVLLLLLFALLYMS